MYFFADVNNILVERDLNSCDLSQEVEYKTGLSRDEIMWPRVKGPVLPMLKF